MNYSGSWEQGEERRGAASRKGSVRLARGPKATEGRGTPHRYVSATRAPSMSGAAPAVARTPAHRFGRVEDAAQGGGVGLGPGAFAGVVRGDSKIFKALITPRVYARPGLTL